MSFHIKIEIVEEFEKFQDQFIKNIRIKRTVRGSQLKYTYSTQNTIMWKSSTFFNPTKLCDSPCNIRPPPSLAWLFVVIWPTPPPFLKDYVVYGRPLICAERRNKNCSPFISMLYSGCPRASILCIYVSKPVRVLRCPSVQAVHIRGMPNFDTQTHTNWNRWTQRGGSPPARGTRWAPDWIIEQ